MKQLHPYLSFDGQCRAAMEAYQRWFGGDLNLIPAPEPSRVFHAVLRGPDFTLMGSDMAQPGPAGANSVVIECDSRPECERLYELARAGGEVFCALGEPPWGGLYAHVLDAFGVVWHLSAE